MLSRYLPITFRFNEALGDDRREVDQLASALFSFGLVAAIISVLSGAVAIWADEFLPITSATHQALPWVAGLWGVAYFKARSSGKRIELALTPVAFGLILILLSDWLTRPYSLFQGPSIRGELIVGSIIGLWLMRISGLKFILVALFASVLLLIWCFITESAGRIIFSDDLGTFLFRLLSLKENFPSIPFYNPSWNGGFDARDFFATGSLNIFLLFAPFIYLTDLFESFNFLIMGLVFGVVPLFTFIAGRLNQESIESSAAAAMIALCSSLHWYRWALKYGTVGFITSAAIIPIILVLTSRLLSKDKSWNLWHLLALTVALTLSLLWTPAGIALAPLIVLGLLAIKVVIQKPLAIITVLLVLAINLPWMGLFLSVSKVTSFLNTVRPSYSSTYSKEALKEDSPEPKKLKVTEVGKPALRALRSAGLSTNPLILVLAIPGLFLIVGSKTRQLYTLSAIWLLLLGTVISPLKPQLDLDRMLVLLSFLLALPTGVAVVNLLRSGIASERRWYHQLLAAIAAGFLLTGPFVVGAIIRNKSVEQYSFAEPILQNLAAAIKQYGGEGRTIFAGQIVHELSGGHIAPLSFMTGKPLMASSHVHDIWHYRDIMPASFRERKDEGVRDYFELYNATAIIAHERFWKEYFRARPDEYQEIWKEERFILFKRIKAAPSYFLSGSGDISQDTNSIRVKLNETSAVLKFNYFPFLVASGCTIGGKSVAPEVTLIELSGCTPGAEIVVRSKPGFLRISGLWEK